MTGGTGFLGGALAPLLRQVGHEVTALVRDPARAARLQKLGVQLHLGDVSDARSVEAGMRGHDAVIHCAGWYRLGICDGREAQGVNVSGTRNVLQAMRDLRIPRGVYTSTIAVNSDTRGRLVDETYRFQGRHLSIYDATKAEAHTLAESFIADGLPLVLLQPGAIYGPGDASDLAHAVRDAMRGRLPLMPRGSAYCWAHVEDVARGHLLALERGQPGRAYFLTGPVAGLDDALRAAAAVGGVRPPWPVPPALLRVASKLTAVLDKILPLPSAYTGEALRVAAGVTYLGCSDRAQSELGWVTRPFQPTWSDLLHAEAAAMG